MPGSSSPSGNDGYPAVVVRLPAIEVGLLEKVLTDAWRCRAPKKLASMLDSRE